MSRCLRERALWGIYEGEGTAAQQATSLQTCVACRVRYQALMHTLEEISISLSSGDTATAGACASALPLLRALAERRGGVSSASPTGGREPAVVSGAPADAAGRGVQ